MSPGDGPRGLSDAPLPSGASQVFGPSRDPLGPLLAPRGVVVLGSGAEPSLLARRALLNLRAQPGGATVVSSWDAATGPVDLALIAEAGDHLATILAECAARGVGAAVVLDPALLRDDDATRAERVALRDQARASGVRLLGPGALGLIRPGRSLNASVVEQVPEAGSLAFAGQDSAATAAPLDWANRWGIGFAAVVGIGAPLEVGWADLIESLGADPATRVIVLAPESLGDARALFAAARATTARVPIVLVGSGRIGREPTLGQSCGVDRRVLLAACRHAGVALVDTVADAFPLADALARAVRPRSATLAVVADSATLLELARLALLGVTLAPSVPSDPADLASWVDAVVRAGSDPATGGVLVVQPFPATVDPLSLAEALARLDRSTLAPILACLLGEAGSSRPSAILRAAGIPTSNFPDIAIRVFAALVRLGCPPGEAEDSPNAEPGAATAEVRTEVEALLARVAAEGRSALDEIESKAVLLASGLAVVRTQAAATDDEAVAAAETLGYPVALKLYSRTVPARAEMGGLRLNLGSPDAVRGAFWGIEATVGVIEGPGQMLGVTVEPMLSPGGVEVAVGGRVDPDFGPVVTLGAVGEADPRAVDLPPLTLPQARRLVRRSALLDAHPTLDGEGLAQLVAQVGSLLIERPRIATIELAPVRVGTIPAGSGGGGVGTETVALDARVTLHAATLADDALPRPCWPATPAYLTFPWTARDGGPVTIRPVQPDDGELIAQFAGDMGRAVAREEVDRLAASDGNRQTALAVVYREPWTDHQTILGLARLTTLGTSGAAEVALLIGLLHRGRGLGSELLRCLLAHAQAVGLQRVVADLAQTDHQGQRVVAKFGARFDPGPSAGLVRATLDLAHLVVPDPDPDRPDHPDSASIAEVAAAASPAQPQVASPAEPTPEAA